MTGGGPVTSSTRAFLYADLRGYTRFAEDHAGETVESDGGLFVDRYRAGYGREPGEYDAAAYACVEVILAALRDVATAGPGADALREAVRASAVDPTDRYETVLGSIGFDANGDSLQQFAEILGADPGSETREPEWIREKAQDYGPAP